MATEAELRELIRSMLEDTTIWPADGRAAGLRKDLEQMHANPQAIDSPDLLQSYLMALRLMRRDMPAEIKRIDRGMLTDVALRCAEILEIGRKHPGPAGYDALIRLYEQSRLRRPN